MPWHAGSRRNVQPSRTCPPPRSRHGRAGSRNFTAAPRNVASCAATDDQGRKGTPPPTTKAEPVASRAVAAARWRRGTAPPHRRRTSSLHPTPLPLLEGGGSCAARHVGILGRGGDDRQGRAGRRRRARELISLCFLS